MFAVLVNRSVSTAVGNYSIISHHIKNIRPRFRLLHLGLLLLQGDIISQPILRNVLREKIYHGALDYFRYVVLFLSFYVPGEPEKTPHFRKFISPETLIILE